MTFLRFFLPLAAGAWLAFSVGCGSDDETPTTAKADVELEGESCGGFAGLGCADGLVCAFDPDSFCTKAGGVDCEGHCVERGARPCGGFLGGLCDEGFTCIDEPDDPCDPTNGGRDCVGFCVRKKDGGAADALDARAEDAEIR